MGLRTSHSSAARPLSRGALWEQAKADCRTRAKEEERLRKAVESRDARLATLVADKQRAAEGAEQRQREVCGSGLG